MNYKRTKFDRLFIQILVFSFALVPDASSALEMKSRFQAGVMDYQFTRKPLTYTDGRRKSGTRLESVLPFAGGGITIFENQFFFDLYLQKAFSGSDETAIFYEDDSGSSSTRNRKINSDFERDEFSVSVGYAVGNQGALFIGYRRSKINFIDTFTYTKITDNNPNYTENGIRDTDFKQSGYFLGGAYLLPIGEHTAITLNAAVAFLDGEFDYRVHSVEASSIDGPVKQDDSATNLGGDTAGLNLGIAWKGRMFESVDYTLGLDGYSYDFVFKKLDKFESIESPEASESVIR